MGFDLGTFLGDITGQNQASQKRELLNNAKNTEASAGQTLQGIAGKGAGQFAQEAGTAGQALGNQMGQDEATLGTQKAMQAARTAGLNKGQAALVGGQQAGQLFTQGKLQGQGLGMNAYGQGAATQLAGAGEQVNLAGQQMGASSDQATQGRNAGQDIMGAVSGGAQGLSSLLKSAGPAAAAAAAKGGIVSKPTNVLAGEAGPEVILPLSDKERTAQLLEKLGFKKGAQEARSMKCPTCGQEMKGKQDGSH